jgi:iron complex outermembrane recepter protein
MCRRLLIESVAVGLACALWVSAHAVAQSAKPIDIPAGDLVSALETLVKQAPVELFYEPRRLKSFHTKGLKGTYSPREAVELLLKDTPLELRTDPGGAMLIAPSPLRAMVDSAPLAARHGALETSDELTQAAGPPSTSSASPAATGGENALEEVIVTATKQAEPLSKVPITVTAYTEQSLDVAGAKSMADIAALTPGVDFSTGWFSNGAETSIVIRGISESYDTAPTTGVYIDDTPVQVRLNSNSLLGNPYPLVFDLDRVEVLQGPQGTLFGAGAEAGTVRFITPEPSLTTYSEYARAEVGDTVYGEPSYEAGVAVGGPIANDELGFRVSAWGRHDGGWVDQQDYETGAINPNNNWDSEAVLRAAFTYAPTSSVRITPSIFYQDVHTNDTSQYWVNLSDPGAGKFVNGNIFSIPGTDRFSLPSLKITADLAWAEFNSISSYFYRRGTSLYDDTTFESEVWAGSAFPTLPGQAAPEFNSETQNVITQELRLSSPQTGGRLDWVMGLFYTDARQQDTGLGQDEFLPTLIEDSFGASLEQFFGVPTLYDGRFSLVSWDWSDEKQYAAYAHGDYDILPDLKLGAGLRVERTEFDYFEIDGGPVNGPPSPHSHGGSQAATPVTPEVNLNYQMTPDDMVYGTVAEGYRIGGVNGPIPTSPPCAASLAALGLSGAPPSYNSDTVWNYEVGTKDKLLDGEAVVDLSLFHDEWRNIQQMVALPACGYLGFTSNLGNAVSNGLNLAVQAHIVGGLRLGLAVGYTDAYYTQTIGVVPAVVVAKGETLGNTPWIVTAIPEYDFQIGEYAVYMRAQDEYHSHNGANWPGNNPNSITYDPAIPLPPATNLLDVRAGVIFHGLDLSLFIDNALNSAPGLRLAHPLAGDPLFYNVTFRPLTAGVTLVYRH